MSSAESGFIYEKEIGEEQVAFANSLGFRDWSYRKYSFSKYDSLISDRENDLFFMNIGGKTNYGYAEYADFYYKGVIIRMEAWDFGGKDEDGNERFVWIVERTYIPKSVWEQRDEIIKQIRAAMMCNEKDIPTEVRFKAEPEMVEKDYNDK